jgi:putative DNA primase/helicase
MEKTENRVAVKNAAPSVSSDVSDTSVTKIREPDKKTFGLKELGFTLINPLDNIKRYPLNDIGAGNLFFNVTKTRLRYVEDAGMWFYYDGKKWRCDKLKVHVMQIARMLVEHLNGLSSEDADFIKFREQLSKNSKRKTMISEAETIEPLSLEDFDRDPLLVNCENCTIDLRDFSQREHDPADFITKTLNAEFNPTAVYERWNKFIDQIMCDDSSLAEFLQKALGYALSGEVSEECLFILYGPTTRNGKGTLMETILYILNDYGKTLDPVSLYQKKSVGNSHSPEIARLAGSRFVNMSELPNEFEINAAKVKQLTGGDMVTTRFLYQDFFEFRPQFKIFINTNYLPGITDDSLFSSGRLKLIPFDRHFNDDEQDKTLKGSFREPANVSAILNWLLEGYKRFKKEKLAVPEKAKEWLKEYRKECDTIGLFAENCLEQCDGKRTKTKEIHDAYVQWCKDGFLKDVPIRMFVPALRKRFTVARSGKEGNVVVGYRLKKKPQSQVDSDESKTDNRVETKSQSLL